MAEAITLLEAWIKLNTKGPDSAQQRDVENSLETFRLGLTGLITTATATATAIFAATTSMAEGLSKTYYEAQRIGSTVERVKAFGQAVEQAGASGPAAIADLEKFSEKFRVNPAFREAIKHLGHLSEEDMKDAQSAYVAYAKVLAGQRKTDPLTYGRSLKFSGLDEATVLAIGRSKFDEANKDAIDFDRGLDEIAKKSVRMNQDWLKVKQHLNTIFDLASGKWMDIETGMLERFDAFLDGHKDLFKKVSDSITGVFFDEKGNFDTAAFGKRVHNAFWDWLHSIDFTKLKNAFIAFANWLTTGWLADKIKGVFGSLGGAVRAAGEAVEKGLGIGGGGGGPSEGSYALDHPGWRPGMPKEKTRHQKELDGAVPPPMPEPRVQEYIKKGGYGPFSHDHTVGAGQDFNIPGQGSFHPIAGGFDDFVEQSEAKSKSSGQTPWEPQESATPRPRPDQFITRPGISYGHDPNMPVIRDDPAGVAADKFNYNKMQLYIDRHRAKIFQTMNVPPLNGGSKQFSRRDEGSKTQDIRVTINSSDPHTAAHETARQLAHLQNQTMRDWRRVG